VPLPGLRAWGPSTAQDGAERRLASLRMTILPCGTLPLPLRLLRASAKQGRLKMWSRSLPSFARLDPWTGSGQARLAAPSSFCSSHLDRRYDTTNANLPRAAVPTQTFKPQRLTTRSPIAPKAACAKVFGLKVAPPKRPATTTPANSAIWMPNALRPYEAAAIRPRATIPL